MYGAIKDFEDEFKKYVRSRNAVAVNNGTSALHAALLANDVGLGDIVVTTPFSFISTSNAILYCGARPVWADVNNHDCLIDPSSVVEAIEGLSSTRRRMLKAILCVHLFGRPCNMVSLQEICEDHQIKLIEDCSQALGRTFNGQHVGTFGDSGTFSFNESKNLSTFEGGMIITESDEVANKIRVIINHGQDEKYHHVVLGYNYRMPEICALVGANYIRNHKKAIMSELGSYGIEDGYYPEVIYNQPVYRSMGIVGDCPNAEKIAHEAKNNYARKHGLIVDEKTE